ncbi:MAG TPA: hypothetical protein VHE09_17020 [Rhizomicrobium sp.]|nr:hypothetical protein [Rhizomicrobium sp.]
MSSPFSIGAALPRIQRGHPLVIVDADEVILRFVAGFDQFLRGHGLFLDLSSYRLHGNVKRLDDKTPVLDVEVTALLEEFRAELDWLAIVDGAREALMALSESAGVVVLTNITPAQAAARTRNLAALGFDFPLVANSGLKGPAVRDLANHAGAPAFFIDDIPQQLVSAAEHAPDVTRIHLVGDERLKPLLAPSPHAHHYAQDWPSAESFIRERLKA